ncbi:MAG: DUF1501 domain-containing protein [Spirochaetes bacterium]|nr:DUF1501 domain-containing protein [Spirochaetota bacterium]
MFADRKQSRREFLGSLAKAVSACFVLPAAAALRAEEDPYDTITLPSPVKSVIFLNMVGGMSHVDTFDPKPDSVFAHVDSAIKGVKLAETFKQTAQVLSAVSLVRTLRSEDGAHDFAQHLVHTGYRFTESQGFPDIPSMGSVIAYARTRRDTGPYFPSCIIINDRGRGGDGGFLGVKYAGFHVSNPQKALQNLLGDSNMPAERLTRREKLLGILNDSFFSRNPQASYLAWKQMFESALSFMNSDKLSVFELDKMAPALRAKFGNSRIGSSLALAYRLAERETPYIQVNVGGWDTHSNNRNKISEICRDLDPALATLLGELKSSGLLSQTLFVLTSEFGRTPEVGGKDGRDHYPKIFTGLIGGGPVAGGMVLGETDAKGEKAVKESWHQKQFLATMYRAAGIDCEAQLMTPSGRPFPLSPRETKLISQLL